MLQCKDVTKETSDYLEGGLPLSKRVALFLHLVICSCCRNYVQQFRTTVETVATAQPQEMDESDRQALVIKLLALSQENNSDNH